MTYLTPFIPFQKRAYQLVKQNNPLENESGSELLMPYTCFVFYRQYGFQWPERMNCDNLPELGNPDNILCMDANKTDAKSSPPPPTHTGGGAVGGGGFQQNHKPKMKWGLKVGEVQPVVPGGKTPGGKSRGKDKKCVCQCESPLVVSTGLMVKDGRIMTKLR